MNSNRIFLITIFVIALYWMFKLFSPFLFDITIASLLALAMYNIHIFFSKFIKYPLVSATLTTMVLCLLFVAPIAYSIYSLSKLPTTFDSSILQYPISYIKDFENNVPETLNFIKPHIASFLKDLDLVSVTNSIIGYATKAGKMGVIFFKDALLIIVFFFFALLYGKSISEYAKSVLPMQDSQIESLFGEITNVMGVVFYSLILNAIFQGALFGIICSFYGYDALLLGIIYGMASFIPVIGGALVWMPVSFIEFSHGNSSGAIIIALYSILMISITADTFIKPLIIKWINKKLVKIPTKINALLIFFSMIAGLATFGFWGMILGPAITTFFLSLLKLYRMIKEGNFIDTKDK